MKTIEFLKVSLLITSFCIAIWALSLAKQANDAIKIMKHASVKPNIELQTEFRLIMDSPPHIRVKNLGLSDVMQMNIKFTSLGYDVSSQIIGVAFSQADWEWGFFELKASEAKVFDLPASLLGRNTRSQEPVHHNILKVRIKYVRKHDLKEFEERAFYFVNPEGRWVPEGDKSINSQEYYEIREAVLSLPTSGLVEKGSSDLLHPVQN